MAYVRPIVMVYQEYASQSGTAQTSTLNPCIVGPCYQVMDESLNTEADMMKAFLANYTTSGVTDMEVPHRIAGAELDPESVKIRITQPFVDMKGSTIEVASGSLNEVTFTAPTFPTGIVVGDFMTLKTATGDVLADKFAVIKVESDTFKIGLSRVLATGTVKTATWLRAVPEFTLTSEDTAVTVTASTGLVSVNGVSVSLGEDSKTLHSAVLFCGYRALRQDVTGFISMGSIDEIETKLGSIVPENPLAYGASIALANTYTSVFTVGVPSDNLAGYTSAKDILEGLSNVYAIVPLTQDAGILAMFSVHAKSMSMPDQGKWRIVFGSTLLPNVVTLSSGTCVIKEDTSEALKVVHCTTATFLSDNLKAGDTFDLTQANGEILKHVVSSIVSEDMLILSAPVVGIIAGTGRYAFKVTRTADKELQSLDIAKTSRSYMSSRFINIWPDQCIIDKEIHPGYYTGCAIAGMVAGLPSQQGFTRIGMGGISGVRHSTDYFNSAQLDNIADGGTMVVTQLSPASPPTIRHQLTTDSSTYEMRELSFVKNFDFVSYICKDVLDNFIGLYNITPSTMAILETVITAAMESLKLASVAKIGSPILDYTKPTVTQSSVERSRVEIYCNVEFPYALNTIGMHIVSTDL